jgi:TonB family protein
MRAIRVASPLLILAALAGEVSGAARVPGTSLRFGAALASLDTTFVAPPDARDTTVDVRRGAMTFFGIPSTATLTYRDGRLHEAEFTADSTSPAARAYIEDELVREGYHRRCARWTPDSHVCDWSGVAQMHLELNGRAVRARVRPAEPALAAAAPAPPPRGTRAVPNLSPPRTVIDSLARLAAEPHPAIPRNMAARADSRVDSARASAASEPLRPPIVVDSCLAVRPEAARRAGIYGRVVVSVLVNRDGHVAGTRIQQGVPELNDAAIECARRYRFSFDPERSPAPMWTPITIRFVQ